MKYSRKRNSLLKKISCVLFICLIIYFYRSRSISVDETCEIGTINGRNVIFNIEEWRGKILDDRNPSVNRNESWCDVPSQFEKLSNALCQMYIGKTCQRLPCYLIYSSSKTLKNISCSHNQTNYLCEIGFSLDLFSNQSSYPSIIVDPFTKYSDELYLNVLNRTYRHCDSIWGLKFNFESIGNYPWNADLNYRKLFDITFGYDRSLFDLVPRPWLYNYISQIQMESKRLSIGEIIPMKKAISSSSNDSIKYWINEEINSSSSVTAPLLWMNSNCQTVSKRTEYMNKLMKYIPVDNYGNCGNNILHLPDEIIEIQKSANKTLTDRGSYLWEVGKLALSKKYLFTIAFENSFDHDYVTEKIWHALITGAVPVYYGAPNIQQWLPCQTPCIIDLAQFKTPKDAASYILTVATNKTLYLQYHQWRNESIHQQFNQMMNYFQQTEHYSLECLSCYLSNQVKLGYKKDDIKLQLKQSFPTF